MEEKESDYWPLPLIFRFGLKDAEKPRKQLSIMGQLLLRGSLIKSAKAGVGDFGLEEIFEATPRPP